MVSVKLLQQLVDVTRRKIQGLMKRGRLPNWHDSVADYL